MGDQVCAKVVLLFKQITRGLGREPRGSPSTPWQADSSPNILRTEASPQAFLFLFHG